MAGKLIASTLSDGVTDSSVTDMVNGKAKAWVNFNGTGTVAIRKSMGVSSIVDNGVGDYTVNFAQTMPDGNYAVSLAASDVINGVASAKILAPTNSTTVPYLKNTSSCRVGFSADVNDFSAVFFG